MAQNDTDKLIDQAIALALDAGEDLDELVEVTIANRPNTVATWVAPAPKGAGHLYDHHDAKPGDTVKMPQRAGIRLAILGFVKGLDRHKIAALIESGDWPPTDVDADGTFVDDLEAGADLTPSTPEEAADLAAYVDGATTAGAEAALTGEPGDLGHLVPDPDAGPVSDIVDAELIERGAEELIGHLTQFPGDAARVQAAEVAGKRRITVLRATGLTDDDIEALPPKAPAGE